MAWCLTWLVQSLALGAMTAALVRLPGFRARAAVRASAWSVALAGTALLAIVPALSGGSAAPEAASSVFGAASAGRLIPLVVLPVVPAPWLGAGLLAWALGTVAWLAYAVREIVRVVRLKQVCEPWSEEDRRRLDPSLRRLLDGRTAHVCWCDDLEGPALLGFRHPIVALPRAQGAQLSDEELGHVLLHEVAHLRRRDDWTSLLEMTVAGVLWVNPVVHMARRSLALAREMACDDWVVRRTSAPASYARCLTTVADLRNRRRRSTLAAAATGARSLLARRVRRMLDEDRRPSARISQRLALLTPVAVGVLAIAFIQAPPLVVDGTSDAGSALPPLAFRPQAVQGEGVMPVVRPATAPVRDRPTSAAASAPGARERTADGAPGLMPGGQADGNGQEAASASKVDREAGAEPPPLTASAVPGVGMPGVPAADASAAAGSIVPDGNNPLWNRAASAGSAASGGAVAASRATASFFKRMGSSVSQTLTR